MFASQINAQVAELVDALVSNTNDFTIVPVRPRPWVLEPVNHRFAGFFCAVFRHIRKAYYGSSNISEGLIDSVTDPKIIPFTPSVDEKFADNIASAIQKGDQNAHSRLKGHLKKKVEEAQK